MHRKSAPHVPLRERQPYGIRSPTEDRAMDATAVREVEAVVGQWGGRVCAVVPGGGVVEAPDRETLAALVLEIGREVVAGSSVVGRPMA